MRSTGEFSRRPYIDMVIPTLTDPSVAPPGKHILSCFVQYAPYHLRRHDWDAQREAFGDTVVDTIAEYAPNIRDIILHRQVLTPLDLEREFGLTEGNIFHGELSLEQLFFLRPAPGWAQYRTPVRGLCRCADRRRTRAAASWARPGAMRRGPSSRTRERRGRGNAQCTMHNAQRPMPNAQCPMHNTQYTVRTRNRSVALAGSWGTGGGRLSGRSTTRPEAGAP